MLSLNPADTLLFNVGVGVFAGLVTATIYFCYRRDFADTYDTMLLRRMAAVLFFVLLLDVGVWLAEGRRGPVMRALGYGVAIAYYIFQYKVLMYWLRYAWYRIFGRGLSRGQSAVLFNVPFAALALLALCAPLNGWLFSLDGENFYRRGVLAVPSMLLVLAYILAVSALAVAKLRREARPERRRELQYIVVFALPPVAGGIVQAFVYGLGLIWPLAAVSSLLVLHEKSSRAILRDALTGLNNRRNLERHLGLYKESGQARPVALLMVDIDDFKQINDQLGHQQGDAALVSAADTLKELFDGTSAFLARYGGDEFVVIMPETSESGAFRAAADIKKAFLARGEGSGPPYPLSVSVGFAVLSEGAEEGIDGALKRADEAMYEDKARHRQPRHARKP